MVRTFVAQVVVKDFLHPGEPEMGLGFRVYWVLVKGFNLSYDNKETALFTMDPYFGNLYLGP